LSSLIHVYACCPSALLSGKLTHYFGHKKGRFLDPFPFTKTRSKTWANLELTSDQKFKLKEVLLKLQANGSIKKSLPEISYISDNKLNSLIAELKKKTSNITLAVVDDYSELAKKSDRIVTLSDYEDQNLFTLSPVQLSQTPTAFLESIPDFIISHAKRFKLVDPYIFEVKDASTTERRLEFVYQVLKKYYSAEENENTPVYIEVYGKEPKNFNLSAVRQHFANFKKLFQSNWPFEINFYVMENKKNLDGISPEIKPFVGKKIHERFFCADALNFSFEDSSEDRSKLAVKQTWRYEPSEKMRSFIACYSENSELFDIKSQFDTRQLRTLSRNQ